MSYESGLFFGQTFARFPRRKNAFRSMLLILLVIWTVSCTSPANSDAAEAMDLASQRMSENDIFSVSYRADTGDVAVNQMHNWTLHIQLPDGTPVENAQVTIDADMPQHGHGMPTAPQVTRYLGDGDYLVEGMKFHMTGWWVVSILIDGDGKTDQVDFNLQLQ